jgi:SAM-dependent methyltransferase
MGVRGMLNRGSKLIHTLIVGFRRPKLNGRVVLGDGEIYQCVEYSAELLLIDQAFVNIPHTHRVLNIPCRTGKVATYLAQQGYTVSAADDSDEMLNITWASVSDQKSRCMIERQVIGRVSQPDRSFDTVVSSGFFHYLSEPRLRYEVIKDLCRVANHYVVLSYYSPLSIFSMKHRVLAWWRGTQPEKHATSLKEIELYFQLEGFYLVKDYASLPLLRTLHLALFERAA